MPLNSLDCGRHDHPVRDSRTNALVRSADPNSWSVEGPTYTNSAEVSKLDVETASIIWGFTPAASTIP